MFHHRVVSKTLSTKLSNVVYHLLGLVKLLFYKLKNKNMEAIDLLKMIRETVTDICSFFLKLKHKT
jgi:rRNA pseudouridine-1189 N-methylase Emg1 (Nep1/Mra1 family)